MAQIQPDQEAGRNDEVRIDVHEVREVDEQAVAHHPSLKALLEEEAHSPLEVDYRTRVVERQGSVSFRDAAHGFVAKVSKRK